MKEFEQMTQKEAVLKAVSEVMKNHSSGFELKGSIKIKDIISQSERQEIIDLVTKWIIDKKVICAKEFSEEEVKRYTPGLIGNWFRKGKELNGNSTYKPGQNSASKIRIRLLDNFIIGSRQYEEILNDLEQEQIKLQKKCNGIDTDALPENLKVLARSLSDDYDDAI